MEDETAQLIANLRRSAKMNRGLPFDAEPNALGLERLSKDSEWQAANEIEKLYELLDDRDRFIVDQGLWGTFVDQLPSN